jgi:hypothetical protein
MPPVGDAPPLSFGPLPLGDFGWLKLYYFDADDEVAGWMVRQYNRIVEREPDHVARWLAELGRDRSEARRGLRWYESFTFRNPEGYRDGDLAACAPTSYDLFHLLIEEKQLGWNPNVTLDPALLGRWTGERSDDSRALVLEFRGDAGFAFEGVALSAFAQQWCVYDGGRDLVLRLLERPGKAVVEWRVMPISSAKISLTMPGCTVELTHAGKGEPSYVGEWLGGGDARARATGLRLKARAGDGRATLALPNLRKLAPAATTPQGLEELGRRLAAEYSARVRASAEAAEQGGDAELAQSLRRETFLAQERVAYAGDRFVIAPHAALHDELAADAEAWMARLVAAT